MDEQELFNEAKRVKELCRIRDGIPIKATFISLSRKKLIIFYFTKKDVPTTLYKNGEKYYLYSIKRAEKK